METSPAQTTLPVEEDEWDTDGFVIPSLEIENHEQDRIDSPVVQYSESQVKGRLTQLAAMLQDLKEEQIYLGPHGAPPSQPKAEQSSGNRKQKLKQKLKEADRRFGGSERENKVENLRELVGVKVPVKLSKDSPRDWLDPHCHESQFERKRS